MRPCLVLLLAAALASCAAPERQTPASPIVILLSFDGWRWDYETKAPAPHLQRLAARGVRAENLIPSFPPKTFPNHYTLVTGLYPGHHGIVANNILDPASGRTFSTSKTSEVRDAMWWGGEPLWVAVERAGRPTAAMFWVGSEAAIGGVRPRYWKPYDESFPPSRRVDQVLQWLDLPATDRPAFITLYFSDVDQAGHASGPDSSAVRDAITRADGYLGQLVAGIDRRGLTDAVNLVVVSDHGMAAVSSDRIIALDDYISLDDVTIADINPTLGLFPKPGKEDVVYDALVRAHPRLRVYRRAETPEAWHYRDHPRIPPIVGVMDEGWQVMGRRLLADIRAGLRQGGGGQHGYDPQLMSMRGLFVAAGPAFKQGVTLPPFENVHVYSGLAQILGVTPAAHDGDPAVAAAWMR